MTKARDIASAAPAPSTVSATELGYLDGVTSAVQTQLDAKTAKSTLTTTGDIYYASAANTPARLGIGSTDQILKVTGGVPAWATPASAGSMTLLSTTTLTGSPTVTISSISQDYKDLRIEVFGVNQDSVNWIGIEPNSTSNITNSVFVVGNNTTPTTTSMINDRLYLAPPGFQSYTPDSHWTVDIFDYTLTTDYKPFRCCGVWFHGHNDTNRQINSAGGIRTDSAITALKFQSQSGDFAQGTVKVYGVK